MKHSFKLIEPFDIAKGKFSSLYGARDAIFLAGPCPREDFADDWRLEAFNLLNSLEFSGTVLTPTNPHFKEMAKFGLSDEQARAKQVAWERAAMHIASAIVFWIPRDEKHPARTTNYEFGEWYKKPSIFVGWPDGAEHNEYMECKLQEQKKTHFKTLQETLVAATEALSRGGTMFFTSDTHFCQQRTLELSRRPFVDTLEMDYEMISNWNKRVTMQDIFVHAGDFIDPEKISTMLRPILSILNFKELHWVLGNYDRKTVDEIKKAIEPLNRPIFLHEENYKFTNGNRSYVVVHEPNDFEVDAQLDDIILFGHIHGRSFAKKNGFDIGIDYHQYSPISLEQVEWFANAMKYWDGNVFSNAVNVKTL